MCVDLAELVGSADLFETVAVIFVLLFLFRYCYFSDRIFLCVSGRFLYAEK
jgi:hypothetical protein